MTEHIQKLVETAAKALAGRAHNFETLHDALYQLAIDIRSPSRLDDFRPVRRSPGANEVLPPHQRASWARAKTEYDRGDGT